MPGTRVRKPALPGSGSRPAPDLRHLFVDLRVNLALAFFGEHQELEEGLGLAEDRRVDPLADKPPLNIAVPPARTYGDRTTAGLKDIGPLHAAIAPERGLGDPVFFKREGLPDRTIVPPFPHHDLPPARLVPERPGRLPEGKSLFEHPVVIEHEPPQDLSRLCRVVFRHRIG